MKAKTKREKKLVKETIKLAFDEGEKYGKEKLYDNLTFILVAIMIATLSVFAIIGIDSLICK